MSGRGYRIGTRGFGLLVVLWFLVLLSAVATYLLATARTETAIARNIRSAARAEALADAGLAQAMFNLTDPVPARRWALDGAPHRFPLPDGEVTVRASDEGAKINPNIASEVLIAALFESAGLERMRARRLGASIADWVGPPGEPRPLGAKLAQYREAGKTYGPPNAAIDSLDELQLVLGMTPDIFALVRPYLTVYGQNREPDPLNAADVVRRAIRLAAQLAPAATGRARNTETAAPSGPGTGMAAAANAGADPGDDPNAAAGEPAVETPAAPAPAQPEAAAAPPKTVVSLEVSARSSDGGVFVREAVLMLDDGNPKSYAVLDWKRGGSVQ